MRPHRTSSWSREASGGARPRSSIGVVAPCSSGLGSGRRWSHVPLHATFHLVRGMGDGEPACRRGSVPRVPCGHRGGGHPSVRSTWGDRPDQSSHVRPCSGWGLPSRRGRPRRWCALTAPFHPCLCPVTRAIGGLLSVALNRQVTPSWLTPAPLSSGAPTFLDVVTPRRGHPAGSPSPPLSHASRPTAHRYPRLPWRCTRSGAGSSPWARSPSPSSCSWRPWCWWPVRLGTPGRPGSSPRWSWSRPGCSSFEVCDGRPSSSTVTGWAGGEG